MILLGFQAAVEPFFYRLVHMSNCLQEVRARLHLRGTAKSAASALGALCLWVLSRLARCSEQIQVLGMLQACI
jgi:hypothetical protein